MLGQIVNLKMAVTIDLLDKYTHQLNFEFHQWFRNLHIRICLNKCTGYIFLETQGKNYFLYFIDYET